MAIGDEAAALGWPLVPDTGEEGRVRHGAREINRTRDMAAEALSAVPDSQTNFQKAAGIRVGTDHPNNLGEPNGLNVVYFRYFEGKIITYMNTADGWIRS